MKRSARSIARSLVAASVAGGLAVAALGSTPAQAQGTPPPWAPGGVSTDANAVGGLTFYNAAGAVITSGSTNTAPFAAYVQGRVLTQDASLQNPTATVFAYVPIQGVSPALWSQGEAFGSSTNYPNASAPAPLSTSTLPVNTGTAFDLKFEDVESDYPNGSTTAGYQNVYEVRLFTGAPQHSLSVHYDYADVMVDSVAHTWTLVYTPDAASTATVPDAPTAAHATAAAKSASVGWTAPANDGGAAITGYDVEFSSNSGSTWTHASSTFHTSTLTTQTVTGLVSGTAYTFRVAAINSIGTGAYSAASAAITPRDVSALTITGSTLENYGTVAAIGGKLTDATTAGVIASGTVKLWKRLNSTSAWVFAATSTSSSTGAVSASITFTSNEQWQWRYAATGAHAAVNSTALTISVKPPITIAAKPTSILHGHFIQFYGTVKPSSSGQSVTLYKLVGTTWQFAGGATLKSQKLPSGVTTVGYVFTVKLATVGSFKYRVGKAATTTLVAGSSATITVKAT